MSFSLVLLLAAGFGCLAHFMLVRPSVRVARAISEAQQREITDRFARDKLAELRDPSIGLMEAYRISTEFLEAERFPDIPVDEVLKYAKKPPLGSSIIATCAATMLCFKLGLFFAAAGLALLSAPTNGQKNKKNRGRKLGDTGSFFHEVTSRT